MLQDINLQQEANFWDKDFNMYKEKKLEVMELIKLNNK